MNVTTTVQKKNTLSDDVFSDTKCVVKTCNHLSLRFDVQDSMLENMCPTDEECPPRSAVMDCN